jgi:threonine dehydratase
MVDRSAIAQTYPLIRPYIRRTPVVEVDGADFGLDGITLVLKLEFMQHSGSFKARGAFTNLLCREVPPAGVVAASGGNHGAAVAYAAMRLGKPARIFVPTVASPAKLERIRGYGADLVVTGDRYADALAASEEWAAQSGALPVHAYEQVETLLGQGTVGLEFEEQDPARFRSGSGGRRRIDRRHRRLVRRPHQGGRRGAGTLSHAPDGDGRRPPRGRTFRRDRRRFAGAQTRRRIDVPHRAGVRKRRSAGARRGDRRAQAALWKTLRVVAEPGGAAALAAVLSGRYRMR